MCEQTQLKRILTAVYQYAADAFADDLHAVILFGSYARGDHDAESDIDIMLLVDRPAEALLAYAWPIAQLSSDLSLSLAECTTISILLKDVETFERYKDALPFYQNVLREGVRVVA